MNQELLAAQRHLCSQRSTRESQNVKCSVMFIFLNNKRLDNIIQHSLTFNSEQMEGENNVSFKSTNEIGL